MVLRRILPPVCLRNIGLEVNVDGIARRETDLTANAPRLMSTWRYARVLIAECDIVRHIGI